MTLIGFVVPVVTVVPKIPLLLSGGEGAFTTAIVSKLVMAVLCAVFVGLCINSFVAVRRRRQAQAAPEP